jgi:hypothetical protein
MKKTNILIVLLTVAVCRQAVAHHSFAVYDIDNKIERTGVLTKLAFTSPHIQLELVVENSDGSTQTWQIESMAPSRWDRSGKPRDIASVGETVTIQGWPARNGEDEMLLSAISTERGRMVIIDKVKQKRARTGIPETNQT